MIFFPYFRRSTYNHLSSWLTDARNLTNPNTVITRPLLMTAQEGYTWNVWSCGCCMGATHTLFCKVYRSWGIVSVLLHSKGFVLTNRLFFLIYIPGNISDWEQVGSWCTGQFWNTCCSIIFYILNCSRLFSKLWKTKSDVWLDTNQNTCTDQITWTRSKSISSVTLVDLLDFLAGFQPHMCTEYEKHFAHK